VGAYALAASSVRPAPPSPAPTATLLRSSAPATSAPAREPEPSPAPALSELAHDLREARSLASSLDALELVKEATRDEEGDTLMLLGQSVLRGYTSFPKSPELGRQLLRHAATLGSAKAAADYAELLLNLDASPPHERAEAWRLLELAVAPLARQAHELARAHARAHAQVIRARVLVEGAWPEVAPHDPQRGLALWRQLSDAGYALAAEHLGMWLYRSEDYGAAEVQLERALQDPNVEAAPQVALARCLARRGHDPDRVATLLQGALGSSKRFVAMWACYELGSRAESPLHGDERLLGWEAEVARQVESGMTSPYGDPEGRWSYCRAMQLIYGLLGQPRDRERGLKLLAESARRGHWEAARDLRNGLPAAW
jgi:hypothetical protein